MIWVEHHSHRQEGSNLMNVSKVMRVIQEFRRHDPELQTQACQAFLIVAGQEGITIRELALLLGMSGATASRNVAMLGEKHRAGGPGLGLVVPRPDPADSRMKRVHLTPKGRTLAETLIAITGA